MTSKFSGSVGARQQGAALLTHVRRTFRQRPGLPESNHKILQVLIPELLLIDLFPIKRLTETPARINPPQGPEPRLPLPNRPVPVPSPATARALPGADTAGRGPLGRQQRRLGALEEDLVVRAGFGAAAEGDAQVREAGELRQPLVRLAGAHAPAQHHAGVGHAQAVRHEAVLRRHVVAEGDVREGPELGPQVRHVGRRGRLPVAEERGDDDEVLIRVERPAGPHEPLIVCYGAREPRWVYYRRAGRGPERLVGDKGLREHHAGDKGEVP